LFLINWFGFVKPINLRLSLFHLNNSILTLCAEMAELTKQIEAYEETIERLEQTLFELRGEIAAGTHDEVSPFSSARFRGLIVF
jgi:ribosomal protein L29